MPLHSINLILVDAHVSVQIGEEELQLKMVDCPDQLFLKLQFLPLIRMWGFNLRKSFPRFISHTFV